MTEEEKRKVERIAGLIKEKQIPVANKDTLLPSVVVNQVQQRLGDIKITKGKKQINLFNLDTHTRCWKKYEVRPDSNSDHPERTNPKYCIYDEPYQQYTYTKEWVDFLVEKMGDVEEYKSLYR